MMIIIVIIEIKVKLNNNINDLCILWYITIKYNYIIVKYHFYNGYMNLWIVDNIITLKSDIKYTFFPY